MNRRGFIQPLIALGLVATFSFPGAPRDKPKPLTSRRDEAILIDANTGQILFEKNADQPYEPASLVKIMTLLVAMDAVKAGKVSLSDPVRTSRRAAAIGGSQVYLAEGETHSLEKMLKAVAIASATTQASRWRSFSPGPKPLSPN